MRKIWKRVLITIVVVTIGYNILDNHSDKSVDSEPVQETIEDGVVDESGDLENAAAIASADVAAIEAEYLATLAPSDDDYDYKWADDFEDYHFVVVMRDSKNYENVFGFSKPTEKELDAAIADNKNIRQKYKDFLSNLVHDWLKKYPDSDFSVLMFNLQSLEIQEVSATKIQMKAASIGTVACYVSSENVIYVRDDIDISDKNSDDYIVLAHEILHAARTTYTAREENARVSCKFYDNVDMGLYEDEAIDTYFVYEMQGMGNKSKYYTLQSSIWRQFLPYMDYDGSDYLNHSLNYFIQQLDLYLDEIGVTTDAYHLVNLVDAQAQGHYDNYALDEPIFNDFSELYEAMAKAYQHEHGYAEMTAEEKQQAYDDFWEDISFNLENLTNPYDNISKEVFEKYWS